MSLCSLPSLHLSLFLRSPALSLLVWPLQKLGSSHSLTLPSVSTHPLSEPKAYPPGPSLTLCNEAPERLGAPLLSLVSVSLLLPWQRRKDSNQSRASGARSARGSLSSQTALPPNPNTWWNFYQLRDLRSPPCPPQATEYRTQRQQDQVPMPESTWNSGQLEHRVTLGAQDTHSLAMATLQRWCRPWGSRGRKVPRLPVEKARGMAGVVPGRRCLGGAQHGFSGCQA